MISIDCFWSDMNDRSDSLQVCMDLSESTAPVTLTQTSINYAFHEITKFRSCQHKIIPGKLLDFLCNDNFSLRILFWEDCVHWLRHYGAMISPKKMTEPVAATGATFFNTKVCVCWNKNDKTIKPTVLCHVCDTVAFSIASHSHAVPFWRPAWTIECRQQVANLQISLCVN